MTFDSLCGKCLHSKESHTKDNGHFMFCATCQSLCDTNEYNTPMKPSGTICQDGQCYQVGKIE